MRSVKLALIAVLLAITSLAATAPAADRGARTMRWDIVDLRLAAKQVLPGGSATSKDAATGDTITITGSGHYTPSKRKAAGGGTFVHKKADGSVVAQGFYRVTKFRSFRVGGGKAPPLTGNIATGQGSPLDGVLRLSVQIVPEVDGKPQAAQTGVLSIYCFFEKNKIGLTHDDEGFTLNSGSLQFKQVHEGGFTVFHRLR
jgi:hypothetical protein